MSKNKIFVKFKLSIWTPRVRGGVGTNRLKRAKKITIKIGSVESQGRDPHGAGDVITVGSGNK